MTNREIVVLLFVLGVILVLVLGGLFTFLFLKNKKEMQTIKNLIIKGIEINADTKSLISMAEEVWRIEKMNLSTNTEKNANIERSINRLKKNLLAFGVTFNDYTNRKFIGINVDVLESKESKDVQTPFISETMKPEIIINGIRVQKSSVVVTQPRKRFFFQIRFKANDGEVIPEITKEEDSVIEQLPIPKRENYEFVHWFDSETHEPIILPYKIKKNLLLTAEWKEIEVASVFPIKEERAPLSNDVTESAVEGVEPVKDGGELKNEQ